LVEDIYDFDDDFDFVSHTLIGKEFD